MVVALHIHISISFMLFAANKLCFSFRVDMPVLILVSSDVLSKNCYACMLMCVSTDLLNNLM